MNHEELKLWLSLAGLHEVDRFRENLGYGMARFDAITPWDIAVKLSSRLCYTIFLDFDDPNGSTWGRTVEVNSPEEVLEVVKQHLNDERVYKSASSQGLHIYVGEEYPDDY